MTPKPDDKPDPEIPPTGDENYTWEETDDGYQLTDKDGEIVTGWAKVDGKWYYLNDNGIRQTGWQKVDNKWYYLKADGVMATGWLKLGNVWYFLNARLGRHGKLWMGTGRKHLVLHERQRRNGDRLHSRRLQAGCKRRLGEIVCPNYTSSPSY